jgi:hypothetical protein
MLRVGWLLTIVGYLPAILTLRPSRASSRALSKLAIQGLGGNQVSLHRHGVAAWCGRAGSSVCSGPSFPFPPKCDRER